MELCASRRVPFASICQANGESLWPQASQAERLRKAYTAAGAAFFVSKQNLELFQEQIGQRLPNAEVVRNPFNVPYETDLAWPSSEKGMRLACVARLDPRAKGQDLLFKLLAAEKWRQRPITASLFGGGPFEGNLRALAGMHGLDSKVVFRGQVHDVREIWRHHHALILPSRFEGLPLVIVEAMLCGRPCIVTDVAGNAELLEDNVSGFVALAPVARLLDEALERAWSRRHEWPEIGARAQATARKTVPADPAGAFAEHLIELAGRPQAIEVTAPTP
jgi:glycosyltransferase involved in cell wall biosynthesis